VNPVSITIMRPDHKMTDQIRAVRFAVGSSSSSSASGGATASAPLVTAGALSSTDNYPQSSYCRWTTTQYTDCCLVASQRVYKLIPSSGNGVSGTNYDETDFGYDIMHRLNRTVTPGGTIMRTVYDAPGRPTGAWVGTNDMGATSSNPAGSGPPNNMVQITRLVYDNGLAGGDSNVTQNTDYVDASGLNDRVTTFLYDFRDRRTDTQGEINVYAKQHFDNLNRVYKSERYDTTLAGNLIGRSLTNWDDRKRIYQTVRYAVDPTTGIVGNSLTDNVWFDASGNTIKSLPAGSQLAMKAVFDSLGRQTAQYTGYNYSDTTYATATSVTGDTILEQTETTFDVASNVVQSNVRQRYHNATGTGPLGSPSSAQPQARVSSFATYPDATGRNAAAADYGTNGGVPLNRPSTIPSSSSTCLVSSTKFNARGEAYLGTDPAGTETYEVFDDAGRRLTLIENYIAISSSSSSSSSGNTCGPSDDTNRTTNFTYSSDNLLATITVVNSTTGNQITTYQYGTTLSSSGVASTLLKILEIYPDSVGGTDQKAFTYNRQSQVTTLTDQNGTVHTYIFDLLGRPIDDRITAVGAGVDTAVLRIATVYEVRGLVQNITNYDNATVGSGNVVNDVQKSYNTFSQLVTEYQSHSGAVNVSNTPNVQYAYANGSANTIRPISMTYPNGRVLNYNYGVANGFNDGTSLIASLIDNDGVTHLADYSYLGAGTIIQVNETQPEILYTLVGIQGGNDPVTGDIYRGLDQFSRVKDLIWVPFGFSSSSSSSSSSGFAAGTNLVRIQHGYDLAGNRLWRKDLVAESYGAGLDELYSYDGLYRLKMVNRGTLNSMQAGITAGTGTFNQCWTLDATGNWKGFREDDTGSGVWDLVQGRSANTVNEISGIANSVGSAWAPPAYDKAGNMTTIPQPATPSLGYTGTYDAWNRLVKLVDPSSGDTVQSNAYDGRNYRTIRNDYTAGVLSEARQYFYTSTWQSIEERVGNSTNPDRQFVWGLRFIDDLVLRDRDTTDSETLDERLYAIQDALGSIITIVNSAAVVQERCHFSPYGAPAFLSATFVIHAESSFDWESLLGGYRIDSATGLYSVRRRLFNYLLGAWLSRDPIGLTPGSSMYSYADTEPISRVDPSGLQTVIIGVINKPPSTEKNDPDFQLCEKAKTDPNLNISNSAADFVSIIVKAYDSCAAAGSAGEDPIKTFSRCCISTLVVDGHAGAGFGGGENFIDPADMKKLSSLFCDNAKIINCSCYAYATFLDLPAPVALCSLLCPRGGTYSGFKGMCRGLYPNVVGVDVSETGMTTTNIPTGCETTDVKTLFEGVVPPLTQEEQQQARREYLNNWRRNLIRLREQRRRERELQRQMQ
jgi:RHS repeat-associated protein